MMAATTMAVLDLRCVNLAEGMAAPDSSDPQRRRDDTYTDPSTSCAFRVREVLAIMSGRLKPFSRPRAEECSYLFGVQALNEATQKATDTDIPTAGGTGYYAGTDEVFARPRSGGRS